MLEYLAFRACQSSGYGIVYLGFLAKLGILAWFLIAITLAVAKLDKIVKLLEKKA